MVNRSTPKKRRTGVHLTDDERETAQAKFLTAYAKTANISLACRTAKVDRAVFYEWKHDPTFEARLKLADEEADDVVEAEIFRRAVKGIAEPVVNSGGLVYEYLPILTEDGYPVLNTYGKPTYKRGKQVIITKYSDTLLIFHAKKRIPAYRDKGQLDVTTNGKDLTGLTIFTSGANADPRYVSQGTRPVGDDP